MRAILAAITALCLLAVASTAMAQAWRPFGFGFGAGGGTITPPPSCTADGKTDWSNACDIPMGVALGVL